MPNLTDMRIGDKETRFEKSGESETRIYNKMLGGLEKKDEAILREALIELMEGFLDNKVRLNFLSFIPSALLNRMVLDGYKKFQFKDEELKSAYWELTGLEWEGDKKAKTQVKKILDKFKNLDKND